MLKKIKKIHEEKEVMDVEEFGEFCHDIKNPLTVMKMNLELTMIDEKSKDGKLGKLVSVMNKEIEKILKIITDKRNKQKVIESK